MSVAESNFVADVADQVPLNERRGVGGPVIVLMAIAALICSGLELEIVMSLDSMLRFMTPGEIFFDAAAALPPLFCTAIVWWLCLLVLRQMAARFFHSSVDYGDSIFWRFGLIVPLIYFSLELFNSTRLRLFPSWHPGLYGWLCVLPILTLFCTALVCNTRLSKLKSFCRTRLVPITGIHVAVAIIFGVIFVAHHVYFFRDYAHPGKTVAASDRPDIYLITLDALRAEDMSVYGYPLTTTPNLENFAKQASIFDFFFANSNFTAPTTTSIETGKLPWTHKVYQLGGFLRGPAQDQTLERLLQQQGYYTASVASNPFAGPVQHRTLNGYDAVSFPLPVDTNRLWFRYTNLVGLNTLHTLQYSMLKSLAAARSYMNALIWSDQYPSPAEADFRVARDLITHKNGLQPLFLWVHIFPPHDPYIPPRPFRGKFLALNTLTRTYNFLGLRPDSPPRGVTAEQLHARYDENIAYADSTVGDFINWLKQTGRFDRSIVIVSADHGESFEHNWLLHTGPYLYNDLIRIPLMIHIPGQKQSSRVEQAGEEVDLLPTILDLVGGKAPNWAEGISLKPALQGEVLPQRFIFSMNLEPDSTFAPVSKGTVAVIDGNFKFIERLGTNDRELYRYRVDLGDQRNLLDSEPVVGARMQELLTDKLKHLNGTQN
jgi:arylsulfatase A-like enzyme